MSSVRGIPGRTRSGRRLSDLQAVSINPQVLYRYFDQRGTLLYVGITCNPGARERQHASTQRWWGQVDPRATTREEFLTRADVEYAEAVAIFTEKPLHNVQLASGARILELGERLSDPLVGVAMLRSFIADRDKRIVELMSTKNDLQESNREYRKRLRETGSREWLAAFDSETAARRLRQRKLRADEALKTRVVASFAFGHSLFDWLEANPCPAQNSRREKRSEWVWRLRDHIQTMDGYDNVGRKAVRDLLRRTVFRTGFLAAIRSPEDVRSIHHQVTGFTDSERRQKEERLTRRYAQIDKYLSCSPEIGAGRLVVSRWLDELNNTQGEATRLEAELAADMPVIGDLWGGSLPVPFPPVSTQVASALEGIASVSNLHGHRVPGPSHHVYALSSDRANG